MTVFDRPLLGRYADWFAVAAAIALPWSTTATALCILFWLVALVGSWDITKRLREPWMPAGALPAALWALGVAGMLWAAVPLPERLGGLSSFHKLLAIPFLCVQFRRLQPRDMGSCRIFDLVHGLARCFVGPVPDSGTSLARISQTRRRVGDNDRHTGEGLHLSEHDVHAVRPWPRRRGILRLEQGEAAHRACLGAVGNPFPGKHSVRRLQPHRSVALPALLVLFGFTRLGWKSTAGMMLALLVVLAVAWPASSRLRERATLFFDEVRNYQPDAVSTSAGERLEYWRKSLVIIAKAPLFGHGTGSTREEFRQLAGGHTGMAGLVPDNPHNQIFALQFNLGWSGWPCSWPCGLRICFSSSLRVRCRESGWRWSRRTSSARCPSLRCSITLPAGFILGVGVLTGMMLRASKTCSGKRQASGTRSDSAGAEELT